MNSFLFAWNPNNWNWANLEECIESVNNSGSATLKWSCISHTKAHPGDRAFLVKLGVEPKGIMGSGVIVSEPFLSQHWSGSDKMVYRVHIEFDTILDPESVQILDLETLSQGVLSKQTWAPQASGISINPDIDNELESIWFSFLNTNDAKNQFEQKSNEAACLEGKPNQTPVTRYERNPHARKACIDYYGLKCNICNFDFEESYGEAGKSFIHVHHLSEISKQNGEHTVEPIKDLRPVCPNCHAIIHRKKPPYTIQEMIKMITPSKTKT